MITLESERNATQRTGVAGVAILKSCRQDTEIGRLIQSEYENEIVRPVLLSEVLDSLLIRKTCGTGCRSDEACCRFVNNFGSRGFDAVANGETRNIVALTKYGCFLSVEHRLLLLRFSFWVGLEHEGYSIVKLG